MRLACILGLSMILLGCVPEKPVPISSFSEKQLVVEGYFTDEIKQHEFSVSLVNDIGDSTLLPVESFDLKLSSLTQQYPFDLVGGTKVVSQSAFSGDEYGIYELQFCYEGVCYKKEIEMPVKPVINSFQILNETTDTTMDAYFEDLDLNISVSKSQYLRYELFWLDEFNGDTTWNFMPQPIYWTTKVVQGTYDYQLNEKHIDHHNLAGRQGLLIKVYGLSNETGQYLQKLESFVQDEFTGSQYQNPPYFYPGRVHGMIYGTVVDSAMYFF